HKGTSCADQLAKAIADL
ncbi:MAG: TSCPD domain-containing protein, partial [Treponema sp.]|nr:TSCPD domain-containing protein [Treponema sp.]